MYRELIIICSVFRTKHNTIRENNVEFWNLKRNGT
jgi:hypothetical protein